MNRKHVYEAIDSEREFQNKLTSDSNRPDMIDDMHIGDTLGAIQYNINKALESWYKGSVPHDTTLDLMRKIAALCVKAGERYGMPKRKEI